MNNDIKVILFDLGGVLINFIGMSEVGKHLPDGLSVSELRKLWIGSKSNAAFERGDITTEEFAPWFIEEFGLELSPTEFTHAFGSWITGPLPGATELLAELRPRYRLACLSNTNELHWNTLINNYRLNEQLDDLFASHILRMIKPHPEIYCHVCAELDVEPNQVVFFDDGIENVASALSAGMHAFEVRGPNEVKARLAENGLLE